MRSRIVLEANVVRTRIDALKASFPELEEDGELLASAVEGETDFEAVLEKVIEAFLDAATMKEAIASRTSALRERGERYDRRADAMRALAKDLMDAAGQPMVRLPIATLSIRDGSQSVSVVDERMLPQGYFTRIPNKTAIKERLKAGEAIPGAELVTGEQTLSVRTK
jgi:hypothetical protein